jgi:hypothetical protein
MNQFTLGCPAARNSGWPCDLSRRPSGFPHPFRRSQLVAGRRPGREARPAEDGPRDRTEGAKATCERCGHVEAGQIAWHWHWHGAAHLKRAWSKEGTAWRRPSARNIAKDSCRVSRHCISRTPLGWGGTAFAKGGSRKTENLAHAHPQGDFRKRQKLICRLS